MKLNKLIKLFEEYRLRDGIATCMMLGFVLLNPVLSTASSDFCSKRFDMIMLWLLCVPVSVPALFRLCSLELLQPQLLSSLFLLKPIFDEVLQLDNLR
jgi:hypothetical protein